MYVLYIRSAPEYSLVTSEVATSSPCARSRPQAQSEPTTHCNAGCALSARAHFVIELSLVTLGLGSSKPSVRAKYDLEQQPGAAGQPPELLGGIRSGPSIPNPGGPTPAAVPVSIRLPSRRDSGPGPGPMEFTRDTAEREK